MAGYPIIFTLIHEITCAKFSARVQTKGRALMVLEDGEWWCHGVEPGGLTDHGAEPGLAWANFKATCGRVLTDLAGDVNTFQEFAVTVQRFVADGDRIEAGSWEAARNAIRSGGTVEAPFNSLTRYTTNFRASVNVQKLFEITVATEEMVALAEAA